MSSSSREGSQRLPSPAVKPVRPPADKQYRGPVAVKAPRPEAR